MDRERTGTGEQKLSERRIETVGTVPAMFSSISDDRFDREEYWRAVERAARTPRTHELVFNADMSPYAWADIIASPDAPAKLRDHLHIPPSVIARSSRANSAAPAATSASRKSRSVPERVRVRRRVAGTGTAELHPAQPVRHQKLRLRQRQPMHGLQHQHAERQHRGEGRPPLAPSL